MTGQSQNKKRHHLIPQFYLKKFTLPPTGQVWTYDKQTSEMRPSSVEDAACERYLYSVTDDDGERHNEIEERISEIEDAAAPLFERIIAGHDLVGQERYNFASFLALMFVRTNAFRRIFAELHGNLKMMKNHLIASNDSAFESQMEKFQADRGILTDEQKQKLRSWMLDSSGFIFEVDREFTLQALEFHDTLTPLLTEMHWTILDVSQQDWRFITSDNPVVHWIAPQHRRPWGGLGLRNRYVEVTFPLSPTLCWFGHWKEAVRKRAEARTEHVKELNRLRADAAERFLYSHMESSGILRLAKKYAAHRPMMEFVGGPARDKRAEVRVVRSLSTRSTDKA